MDVYVTIDLDCLRSGEAVTNWENGRFTVNDLSWALAELRAVKSRIVAADVCGAFSPPVYSRLKQRFAARIDHPKLPPADPEKAQEINLSAFHTLWPLLTG
jgi:arginase family enzyme